MELKNQIAALEKLAKDEKSQQELGKRLIQEVAQAIYEEKRGVEIANPDLEMIFKKGEEIPIQFRDRIKTDADGRAIDDFAIQYLNLRIWFRIWIRFWARFVFRVPFLETNPLNRFQDFADRLKFSEDEISLIDKLKKSY